MIMESSITDSHETGYRAFNKDTFLHGNSSSKCSALVRVADKKFRNLAC